MEVRIGIQHAPREVILESALTADALHAEVDKALVSGGPLRLHDEKGRVIIVPSTHIAYVDIAASEPRRIGFGGVAS